MAEPGLGMRKINTPLFSKNLTKIVIEKCNKDVLVYPFTPQSENFKLLPPHYFFVWLCHCCVNGSIFVLVCCCGQDISYHMVFVVCKLISVGAGG